MNSSKPQYYRHRFPAEIISRCVWLYFRFSLSYRDVEEMMAERGVAVSYETIRDWTIKFGGLYAKRLKSKAKRPGDCWHLDEVFLNINGTRQYLWRAVDQDGEVLDILVQPRRNKHAAKKFFHRLLKKLKYVPRLIVTDKLGSYAAAKREIMPTVKHVRDKGANNRAENSHQPTRERERRMRGFKTSGHAQRFLSTFSVISSFFKPGRHLLAAKNYREIMRRRFADWFVVVHSPITTA
jgi:putative transposase